MNDSQPTPMQRAVDAATGQTALARLIGCTQGLIWHYVNGTQLPPPERCKEIERVTGVTCEDLRPDIEWDRSEGGAVTGYRVRFPTAASVVEDASTVDPAVVGVVEGDSYS